MHMHMQIYNYMHMKMHMRMYMYIPYCTSRKKTTCTLNDPANSGETRSRIVQMEMITSAHQTVVWLGLVGV